MLNNARKKLVVTLAVLTLQVIILIAGITLSAGYRDEAQEAMSGSAKVTDKMVDNKVRKIQQLTEEIESINEAKTQEEEDELKSGDIIVAQMPTNVVNVNYFLGQLAEVTGVNIAELRNNGGTLDIVTYGYYTELMLFYKYINHFTDKLSVNHFNLCGVVTDKGTSNPIEGYKNSEPLYDWTSGSSVSVQGSLGLFYFDKQVDNIVAQVTTKQIDLDNRPSTEAGQLVGDYPMSREDIVSEIIKYSNMYQIPPSWGLAIVDSVSAFNIKHTNNDTGGSISRGLFGITSTEAPMLSTLIEVEYSEGAEFLPKYNIHLGMVKLEAAYKVSKVPEVFLKEYFGDSEGLIATTLLNERMYQSYNTNDLGMDVLDYTEELYEYTTQLDGSYAKEIKSLERAARSKDSVLEKVNLTASMSVEEGNLFTKDYRFSQFKGGNVDYMFSVYGNQKHLGLGVGNNGFGVQDNIREKLYTDKVFRADEIARTKLVIKSRMVMGLSVERQYRYLNRLLEIHFVAG